MKATYLRISKDPEGTGVKTARQLEECTEYAKKRGWEISDTFRDDDLSAFNGDRRPGYRQLVEAVKAGAVTDVITFHLDRLYRNPRELEDLIDLVEGTGLHIWTTSGGDFDLNTSDGRAFARMVTAMSRKESEDKSRRIRSKKQQLARNGLPSGGGRRPFGYEADGITINQPEAELVREAARRSLNGESLGTICRDWADRGIHTSQGAFFRSNVLSRLLARPRIAGLREHKGEIIGEAKWPAILDRDTFERLRSLLTDPTRHNPGPTRRYLLSGIMVCGECGVAVRVKNVKALPYHTYSCRSEPGHRCGKTSIKGPAAEDTVIEALLVFVDDPKLTAALGATGTDVAPLQERALHLEAKLEEMAVDYAADRITRREWFAARERNVADLEQTRRQIDRERGDTLLAGLPSGRAAVEAWWGSASLAQRQALLKAVFERVTLNRATSDRRIDLTWRA